MPLPATCIYAKKKENCLRDTPNRRIDVNKHVFTDKRTNSNFAGGTISHIWSFCFWGLEIHFSFSVDKYLDIISAILGCVCFLVEKQFQKFKPTSYEALKSFPLSVSRLKWKLRGWIS